MATSRFVEVSDKEISESKINSVLKNTKGLCKNTKTIVRLRLSYYRGIFTSILYSTNFWHSSKVQIENCNHGTVRGNKAEQHGNLSLFSFWMDELDTDTNEEDAIPSPMRDEGKPPSSPVDSGISNK